MNFLKWILWVTVISVVLFIGTMILGFFRRIFSRFCRSYYPCCHFIFSMVIF